MLLRVSIDYRDDHRDQFETGDFSTSVFCCANHDHTRHITFGRTAPFRNETTSLRSHAQPRS